MHGTTRLTPRYAPKDSPWSLLNPGKPSNRKLGMPASPTSPSPHQALTKAAPRHPAASGGKFRIPSLF